jgi:hypothetical protein
MSEFNLGELDAPENKEKVYIKPGFRKLTVKNFEYTKEDEGKTPLIIMNCTGTDVDGNELEFSENLYISGKLNKNNVMSSVVRLQELFKGLTGDKMTIKPTAYTYTKKEMNGTSTEFTIPNPSELCDYLNKKCSGKTAMFKVGGEETEDGRVYTKLTYSGFLYYTDRQGNLCRYKEERDFTDSEFKYAVQKRKTEGAPAGAGAIADTKTLDDL